MPYPSRKPFSTARRPVCAWALGLAAAYLCVVLASCAPAERSQLGDRERLIVAATVPPHAWLVEEIAGGRIGDEEIEVLTFLPAGASPHSHLPTDAEISRLARARVLFRSGVPIEHGAWLSALRSAGVAVVDLRSAAERRPHADPHTWLSPRRLRAQARSVEAALAELLPAATDDLARRGERLAGELEALDDELAERLSPHAGREFFVYHPSWTYFADDYELVQVAVERHGSPPADAELADLRRRVEAAGAHTLFVDPRNAGSGARALASTLGLELRLLDPLARDVPASLRHATDELIRSWTADRPAPR